MGVQELILPNGELKIKSTVIFKWTLTVNSTSDILSCEPGTIVQQGSEFLLF